MQNAIQDIEIQELVSRINMDSLDDDVKELIEKLLAAKGGNNAFGNILDKQRLYEIDEIAEDTYKAVTRSFGLSQYIRDKGLENDFVTIKKAAVQLIDANELAEASFKRGMFAPVDPEVKCAGAKAISVYEDLKASSPKELGPLVWDLNEAYDKYLEISTEKAYFTGFHDALNALKGGQA